MDAELEHLKACIADLRNGVIKDIRVECVDGSTEASSVLVSARSGVFKRMLDGTFKEGIEKQIQFPTSKVETVERVLEYVQYGTIAEVITTQKTFDDFEFAHMYGVDAYADIMIARLITAANDPAFAVSVYVGCGKDPRYAEIKSNAQKTIFASLANGQRFIFFCNKCRFYQAVKFKCSKNGCPCKPVSARTEVQCKNGQPIIIPPTSCRDKNCDGRIDTVSAKSTVLAAPVAIRLEIFDAYLKQSHV